jgi:hypothetical protein
MRKLALKSAALRGARRSERLVVVENRLGKLLTISAGL